MVLMTPTITNEQLVRCREVSIHRLMNLTNANRRAMVRCPFHSDRTASMAVYPSNGFHCFGCGAHGNNAVDLVMKLTGEPDQKKAFQEAIKELINYI